MPALQGRSFLNHRNDLILQGDQGMRGFPGPPGPPGDSRGGTQPSNDAGSSGGVILLTLF